MAVTIVVIKTIRYTRAIRVADVEIEETVAIEVAPGKRDGPRVIGESGGERDVGKMAVIVAIQFDISRTISDGKIGPTIVVVISPRDGNGRTIGE